MAVGGWGGDKARGGTGGGCFRGRPRGRFAGGSPVCGADRMTPPPVDEGVGTQTCVACSACMAYRKVMSMADKAPTRHVGASSQRTT